MYPVVMTAGRQRPCIHTRIIWIFVMVPTISSMLPPTGEYHLNQCKGGNQGNKTKVPKIAKMYYS